MPLLFVWITLLALAALATRRITTLSRRLSQKEQDHSATLTEVDQLQTQNAMLDIIARSVDVPLAFQALAARVARLAPCDRVGLALLSDDGKEFQTYTARVEQTERRSRPRPEIVFKVERTILGGVVRSREPMIINDIKEAAPDYLDANILLTSGFKSALLMPLVSRGRAVGTLNVVSRQPKAFGQAHIDALHPIAGDPRRRVGRAAAAHDARQAPDDGSDVGADAVGSGRDQQRPPDHHRPLRPHRTHASTTRPCSAICRRSWDRPSGLTVCSTRCALPRANACAR